jgi:hypothetical protein
MTFTEFMLAALQTILVAVAPVFFTFLTRWINAGTKEASEATKNENIRHAIETVGQLVNDVVLYVSQTYVDALKKENAFTREKQIEALQMAFDRARSMIDERSKTVIESVFGDISTYLYTLIEARVRLQKPQDKPAE